MYELFGVDALYIVSDLHLGGERQPLFRSGQAFGVLVGEIEAAAKGAKQGSDPAVALVINGDFVDFLAEPEAEYFSPLGAIGKLRRILTADKEFLPVTEALRSLLKIANVRIVVALGNHDLELALPWVARELTRILTEGDPAAASRLHLVTGGTGVRMRVGAARVLCIHGNEFDPDNVTDHESIRRIARDLAAGLPAASFIPNAGTRLVVDAINPIKVRHPFIDLLKPERTLVLPVLVALEPGLLARVPDLLRLMRRSAADGLRMRFGFLDERAGATEATTEARLSVPDRGAAMTELFRITEDRFRSGVDPMDLVDDGGQGMLGIWAAAGNLVRRRPRHEVLRELLEHLDADESFALDNADGTFLAADAAVGGEIDFIVTGHTHLRRARRRRRSTGYYYNTGTWAGLMRLDPAVRRDAAKFERFFDSLATATLDALEADDTLRREPVHALIRRQGCAVLGELQEYDPVKKTFAAVLGSAFKMG